METLKNIKKMILGHENVELADILQIILLVILLALFLFVVLKSKRII